MDDLGCAWNEVKICFDNTSVRARAEHLGLANLYLLVARMAVERDNNIGKVRHGAVRLLGKEEGKTRTI